MRVLQLEDDTATAEKVQQTLRTAGFDCETAGLGDEALRLAREQDYDVILLNLGLSNGGGHDILKRLQQSQVRAPVLVNFGAAEGDRRRASLEVVGRLADLYESQAAESRGAERPGDRRRSPRTKTIKGGEIVFNDNQCLSECVILDMSEGGAALQPSDALNFPPRFLLRFKFGPTYACEVCWKKANKIGIRFLDHSDVS